jgi:TolB-like protein/Flp pilus assembly protein TadD
MSSFYQRVTERKITQTILLYAAGSWGVLEALGFFSDRYNWPTWLFDLTLVIVGCGLLFSIIRAWFHGQTGKQAFGRTELILIVATALIAVSLSVAVFMGRDPGIIVEDKSIAVLPFVNLSNDPDQEYFSEGVAEDILNHLAKISDLRVKSRTSTIRYKDSDKNIFEIARELGVQTILEGSIRRVGNVVRVVVQLIDAQRDENVWSGSYDRELKDILAVQSEIAIEIANALKVTLTQTEKGNISVPVSSNVAAYDYYLRARQIMNESNDTKRDIEVAMGLLDQAIKLDRNFAAAYALKGTVWNWYRSYGIPYTVWRDSTLYYASSAISLDPVLPDGYILRSRVYGTLNQKEASRRDLQEAGRIAPNNPAVLEAIGTEMLVEGDSLGAVKLVRAVLLKYSKEDPDYYRDLGWLYFKAKDYEKAEKILNTGKRLSPDDVEFRWRLAFLYRDKREYEKGLAECQEAVRINANNPTMIDILAWAYYLNDDLDNAEKYWSMYPEIESKFKDTTQHVPFRLRLGHVKCLKGDRQQGIRLIHEAISLDLAEVNKEEAVDNWPGPSKSANYYNLAAAHAYLGDRRKAIEYLDTAIAVGNKFEWGYRYDPLFAELREDNAFQSVVRKPLSHADFEASSLRKALAAELPVN